MKSYILCLLAMALPIFAIAQSNAVETFFQKYANSEAVTEFDLQGFLLNVKGESNNLENKISKLRGLVIEEANPIPANDLQDLILNVKKEKFEEIIKVRSGDTRVEILVKDNGDQLTDALVMVNTDEEFVLLALEGALNFEDLQNLDFDFEGLKGL